MRILLLLLFSLVTTLVFSQQTPRLEGDTLFTTSGYKVVDGSYLILGTGTLSNGDYKYVINSSKGWSLAGKPFPRKLSGKAVRVKGLRKEGSKKKGFSYYLLIESESISSGECDIENAITSGEIIIPKEFSTASADPLKTNSVADEIKKLKTLLDQGAITRDEYEAAKKKLLNP